MPPLPHLPLHLVASERGREEGEREGGKEGEREGGREGGEGRGVKMHSGVLFEREHMSCTI